MEVTLNTETFAFLVQMLSELIPECDNAEVIYTTQGLEPALLLESLRLSMNPTAPVCEQLQGTYEQAELRKAYNLENSSIGYRVRQRASPILFEQKSKPSEKCENPYSTSANVRIIAFL